MVERSTFWICLLQAGACPLDKTRHMVVATVMIVNELLVPDARCVGAASR